MVKESDYTPWELAYEWAKNLIFEWDFRRSMGTPESLRALGVRDLKEWHTRFYNSSNAVLLISSPIEVDFDMPTVGEIPERRKVNYEEREITLERGMENAEIVFAFPFEDYDIRAFLLSKILGNYPTSKFWKAFHRDAYMVESRFEWHGRGGFFMYMGANSREHMSIRKKFVKFIENMRISPEDLEIAKKIAKIEILEKAESAYSLMHILSIDPELSFGGFAGMVEGLKDVDIGELRDYASSLFDLNSMFEAVVK